jgi:hypothetical protein
MVAATLTTLVAVVPVQSAAVVAVVVLRATVDLEARPTFPRTLDAVAASSREVASPALALAPALALLLPKDVAKARLCEASR